MRVPDHGCWMCGAGDTAKPPISLLLCCLSELSVRFPLPAPFFFCNVPFSPYPPETPFHLSQFPWKSCPWTMPLDHALGNVGISLTSRNTPLSWEQPSQASVLAPPGITDGREPELCFALGCLLSTNLMGTRTVPMGGVQVQPPTLLHQGLSCARAARTQMGAVIWGCYSKA